jgi:Fe-S-cluster containining protein
VIRCLSLHAGYRCRDSGACCSSGWPIPIEVPLYERLVETLVDGTITTVASRRDGRPPEPFMPSRALPEGAAAVLGQTDEGRCVFHDAAARRCGIQRVKGHAALPVTCQQFPRMCVIDPRGIHITLSHYCPTAAGLLFEEIPLAIVQDPPAFPSDFPYEGLDAHDAFPPLLRPGVLMDWETLDAFEAHALRLLDAETHSVEAALARIEAIAEQMRAWRISDGPLLATFHRAAASETPAAVLERALKRGVGFEILFQLDAEVRAAVPAGSVIESAVAHRQPAQAPHLEHAPPRALSDACTRQVDPVWSGFTRPLCRYLAARLFANWCWYHGQGLRTLIRALQATLAVLRLEAARQTLANGRILDQDLLREAFRRTDLLLIHLCAQETLARGWAAAEQTP